MLCALLFSYVLFFLAADKHSAHLDIDSPGYVRIGNYFAQTGSLIDPEQPGIIPTQTLGYPLLLGTIFKYCGNDFYGVIALQVILNICIGLLIFAIAQTVCNQSVARIAILLWSFNLGYAIFAQFIMTDLVLAFLLLFSIWLFIVGYKNRATVYITVAGFLFGVSVIVKPVALFYTILLSFFVVYAYGKKFLMPLMFFFFSFSVPIISYVMHNWITFNQITISPIMHENINRYFLSHLVARDKGISYQEAFTHIGALFIGKNNNDSNRWREPQSMLYDYFKRDPLLLLFVWLHNVIKTLGGFYTSQLKYLVSPSLKGTSMSFFEKPGSMLQRLYAYVCEGIHNSYARYIVFFYSIYFIVQLIMMCIGFCVLIYNKMYDMALLFAGTVAYFSLITGHDGCARYRLMFEYIYIILAAIGLYAIFFVSAKRCSAPIIVRC